MYLKFGSLAYFLNEVHIYADRGGTPVYLCRGWPLLTSLRNFLSEFFSHIISLQNSVDIYAFLSCIIFPVPFLGLNIP